MLPPSCLLTALLGQASLTGLQELYLWCRRDVGDSLISDVLADIAVELTRLARLSLTSAGTDYEAALALQSVLPGLQHFGLCYKPC